MWRLFENISKFFAKVKIGSLVIAYEYKLTLDSSSILYNLIVNSLYNITDKWYIFSILSVTTVCNLSHSQTYLLTTHVIVLGILTLFSTST